jgi:hypothetical protein
MTDLTSQLISNTDTLFFSIAAFSTVTVDLNVAAPTAVTVP